MHKADLPNFSAMLDDVWGLKGQSLTAGQKAMYFRALCEYSLDAVRAGLDAHIKTPKKGTFLPMPADVIEQIEGFQKADGRLGPEEAWALAASSQDEAKTVVWTTEIAEAWGIALPVFLLGDEVGARMAFKEAYTRLLDVVRRDGATLQWNVSLGHDSTLRDTAIADAIRLGRLSQSEYPQLPPPMDMLRLATTVTEEKVGGAPPPHIREKLASLMREFKAKVVDTVSLDAQGKADTKAKQFELRETIEKMKNAEVSHG